jgi:hypothetical protein
MAALPRPTPDAAHNIEVGDVVLYRDDGGQHVEVTVTARDDATSPPGFTVTLPGGATRDTEAARLSRSKKRQASPSLVDAVSVRCRRQSAAAAPLFRFITWLPS